MNRVAIVTGCYGFLGQAVTAALKTAGWHVCGVAHARGAEDGDGHLVHPHHLISASVSPESLRLALVAFKATPDAIVHAAGNGSVPAAHADPAADFHRSVTSVSDTLAFIRNECPEAQFIFPSSASVYGQTARTCLHEDLECAPISVYGMHKQICENLIAGYARTAGLRSTVIRFFSLYGPGLRKQLIWDVCEQAARPPHKIVLDGDGSDARDFLLVSDAAELVRLAAMSDHRGVLTVNGGSGIAHSVAEIGTRIAELYKVAPPVFSAVARPWDPSFFLADMTRAREKLGFIPHIGLDEGLESVVRWHKAQSIGNSL